MKKRDSGVFMVACDFESWLRFRCGCDWCLCVDVDLSVFYVSTTLRILSVKNDGMQMIWLFKSQL